PRPGIGETCASKILDQQGGQRSPARLARGKTRCSPSRGWLRSDSARAHRGRASVKFVLDASLTLALFVEDEATVETERVYDQLAEGAQALCPAHWPLEVANALLMAERRKQIQVIKTSQFLDLLVQFFISVEPCNRGL